MSQSKSNHKHGNKITLAGEGEKAQYLIHERNDNTIRFALQYPGKLSADLLEQATRTVIFGIDVLHASFVPKALEAVWVVHDELAVEDYFSFLETDEEPMSAANDILLKPVLPEEKAQLKCTLIQGKTASVLVVLISHLCVDGGDGKYLLGKLVEAYNLLATEGNCESLDLKDGSRSVFQIYKGLSHKEFVSAIKPTFPAEKTIFPFPEEGDGYPHLVKRTLDTTVMQKVKQYGKAHNATINDMLLTAYSRAYIRLPKVDKDRPVNIMSMMDLRRYCKSGDSEGLSNLVGSMSTLVQIAPGETFGETLQKIAAQTRETKESPVAGLNGMPVIQTGVKRMPMGIAIKVADKVYGDAMPIGLTNLGNFSGDTLALENLYPTELVFGGPSKKKNGMQISAAGLDGVVTLCCVGEYGDTDAELITLFLQWLEEELKEIDCE